MNNTYKTYKISLLTRSPLFVGDGRTLNKKEYVKKGQVIMVPDMHKMYSDLISLNLVSSYEAYMLSGNKEGLGDWLAKNKIKETVSNSWKKYRFACDVETQDKKETEIRTFVKDAYGCPYVPGSSLKGMLRTILLSYFLIKDADHYRNERRALMLEIGRSAERNRTKYLKAQVSDIETKAFHTMERLDEKPGDIKNAVNDVMSQIIVSDSKPLPVSCLTLCQKIDATKDGKLNMLNLARECVKPNTTIEFDLTLTDQCPYTIDDIKEAIKVFATSYSKNFSKYFRVGNADLSKPYTSSVWLGGGAGYVSKTIIYPLFGHEEGVEAAADIFRQTVNVKGHNHSKDYSEGVSPHMIKCTKYNGKLYEFGECVIKFTEVGN